MLKVDKYSISHVYRVVNKVADALSEEASSSSMVGEWKDFIPPIIRDMYLKDIS